MKKIIFICAGFVLALTFFSCGDGTKASANGTVEQPEKIDGAALYDSKCAICHGGDGKAGVTGASDLSVSTLDHAAAVNVVKNGRKGMRAFGGEMSDAEIEAVVKYAETLKN
jgi:cytochrome c6